MREGGGGSRYTKQPNHVDKTHAKPQNQPHPPKIHMAAGHRAPAPSQTKLATPARQVMLLGKDWSSSAYTWTYVGTTAERTHLLIYLFRDVLLPPKRKNVRTFANRNGILLCLKRVHSPRFASHLLLPIDAKQP